MLSEATWAWLLLFTAGCLVGGGNSSLQLRTQVCPENDFWSCFLAQLEFRSCSVRLQTQCHVQGNANRTASIKPYLPWVTLSLYTLPPVAAGTSELGPAGLRENAIFLSNSNQENKRITIWNAHPKPEKPWSQNPEKRSLLGGSWGGQSRETGRATTAVPPQGTQLRQRNETLKHIDFQTLCTLCHHMWMTQCPGLSENDSTSCLTETVYSICHKKQRREHELQFLKTL